ncbi:DUF3306 domain-containing protein [Tropicimonas isoalkanivorans]|uniref:DUF3306 domain-containing protein n=1 Tax=Tropicimonas isoalkanivorans TaxID=441112 RepID=A0A1I1DAV5_9RHOB|nr:DUF3306 domain-containing protein [Tropicimonas isoalkanivorans]SFB72065.1 Protein of unknown function [Tropicimonas isoalkanivorans]
MSDFWTRRKAAVEAEVRAEEVATQAAQAQQTEEELAARSDADILKDLGLPAPEMLMSSKEVRAFLAAAVPQRLKTRALRRLWGLNPVLANLDGLVDYGEDFNAVPTGGEIKTAYQVGKGIVRRVMAEGEGVDAESGSVEPQTALARNTDGPEEFDRNVALEPSEPATKDISTDGVQGADEAQTPSDLRPRRMNFRFEAT